MATIADLWVTLGLRGDGFNKGLDQAESRVDSFVNKMAAAGQKMVGIGKGMSLAITTPIAIGAKFAIGEASDLAEAQSAVATVYGDAAKDIHGATGSVAKDLGLSRSEALQAATGFGVFAKGAGLSGDAAVGFSNDLVGASADLASFYNTSSPEVLEAIQSGLTGETEPLRKFGILLNEASLQEYALANGIWDGSTAMTEQQKVLARQGFIMENLGDAQGDFARTQDSMANRFKIMQKRVKDFAGVLGTAMMPAVEKVMGWLEKFASALEGLSPTMLKWGVIILGVVAAIGPLLIVLGYFLSSLAPIGIAIALLLSPIGLLVAAIVGLAIVFRGPILDALSDVGGRLKEFGGDVKDVYDRLRETEPVFNEWGMIVGETEPKFSRLNAGIRAFGSGLEDLTGIEMSAFFGNIAQAADALMARDWSTFWDEVKQAIGVLNLDDVVVNFGKFIWGTAIPNLWEWVKTHLLGGAGPAEGFGGSRGAEVYGTSGAWSIDLPQILLNLPGYVWGGLVNLWGWVKTHLMGDAGPAEGFGGSRGAEVYGTSDAWSIDLPQIALNTAGYVWNKLEDLWGWVMGHLLTGTGGFGGSRGDEGSGGAQEYTMPPILVNVRDYLRGEVKDAWTFIEPFISGGGGGGFGGSRGDSSDNGRTVTLGPWTLNVPPPSEGITFNDVQGWLDTQMEGIVGVDIEIQNAKWDIVNPTGDLTLMDIQAWVDQEMESMIGVKIEIQNAKIDVDTGSATESPGLLSRMITRIDLVMEKMFAGGHKIELQNIEFDIPDISNPFEGLGWKVRGWIEDFKSIFTGSGGFGGSRGDEGRTGRAAIFDDFLNGMIEPLLNWQMPDIPNPFAGLGPMIQGWIDNIPMPSVPEWLKKMASGDIMGAIGAMIGTGDEGWGMSAPVTPPGYGPPGGQTQPGTDLNLGDPAVEPVGKAFVVPAPDFSKFLTAHDTAFADANTKGLQFVTDSTNHGVLAADGFNNTFILDPAVAHAGAVQGSLESIFSGVATNATNMGMVAGQGFNAGITQGTNQAVSQAGAAQASLAAIGNGIAASLTVAGFNAGSGFAAGIWAGMSEAVSAAGAAANGIRGAVSFDLYNQGYSIGSSLGLGVSRGILDTIQAAVNAAASLVNATVSAARGAGGIASPSKVMAEMVGKPLAQGVALGIRQGVRDVDRAALGLVPTLRPNSVPGIDAYGSAGVGGGIHVSLTVQGDVYDGDGFEDRVVNVVVDKVVPAVAEAARQRDRAIGVRR